VDQVLTLDILGQPFTFKADVDAKDAKAVADYVVESVDRARSQCAQKTVSIDKRAILILTALNITNEYFELKKRHQRLLHDLNRKSDDLLQSIESHCN
jgi:cell division protein ZapA (FtsZ GTPase activity inhibitor)